jgi:spore germination protein YaaH
MNKPVFYDPQRKRWKRLRRIFDVLALIGVVLGGIFIIGLLKIKPLPELRLTSQTRNYKALTNPPKPVVKPGQKVALSAHRKTQTKPSDIVLNSGEGLRAAYYVDWDPASYSSLKQHIKQIDLLFPEWLHVTDAAGTITAFTAEDNRPFNVVDKSGVRPVDQENKIARAIADNHVDTEVFPIIDNYDLTRNAYSPLIGQFLGSDAARANFVQQIDRFLAANPGYRGITFDFEDIPVDVMPEYKSLIAAVYADLHPRNLRLYLKTLVGDPDYDLGFMAANCDGLVLMDYDEHQTASAPGPISSQDWFLNNLKDVLQVVPKQKIIVEIGSYGYDWTLAPPPPAPAGKGRHHAVPPAPAIPKVLSANPITTQDAWQSASDAGAQIEIDPDSLDPHFAYDDEDAHTRHQVWYLDAVTVLNQMRAARALGIGTFSLWRLGSEDDSLWKIWDTPTHVDPQIALASVNPGHTVDTEGAGDILRVTRTPRAGSRTIELDDDDSIPIAYRSIVKEAMTSYPLPYTITQYGYHPKQVALSFDDGPDPDWTPKILDVLKEYNVKGTFFEIGEVAEDNVSLMRRVYREGHEIGNHTFTHPDISEISEEQVKLQLDLTERLFASKLGVNPIRPTPSTRSPTPTTRPPPSIASSNSAMSSLATRSTQTTGSITPGALRKRSPTPSSSSSPIWRSTPKARARSSCCTMAAATALRRSPRCLC